MESGEYNIRIDRKANFSLNVESVESECLRETRHKLNVRASEIFEETFSIDLILELKNYRALKSETLKVDELKKLAVMIWKLREKEKFHKRKVERRKWKFMFVLFSLKKNYLSREVNEKKSILNEILQARIDSVLQKWGHLVDYFAFLQLLCWQPQVCLFVCRKNFARLLCINSKNLRHESLLA